jgi:trimeric autotransporter adhesin
MKRVFALFIPLFFLLTLVQSQTPVPMASQPGLTYTENFADIANWTNGFAAGAGANRFSSVVVNATGTIPDGVRITTATSTFSTGTAGGVQRGTGNIVLLSTGATDNSSSTAIDFLMDFTGTNAGTLSFDWAAITNSTGDRKGSLRVYYSTNGGTFTELTTAQVLNFTNNIVPQTTGSIVNVALPAAFNNTATARLRFYYHNGSGGTTGSRPKISIDNLTVTATASASNTAVISSGINAQEPATNGTFTVTLNNPAPAPGVTVNYNLTGTATVGTDYTDPQSGSITIPTGSTTGTVTLNVVDDAIYEPTKTIILTMTSANNGFIASTTPASINLLDNDVTAGIVGNTYNLNSCSNFLQQGFREYSVTGAQLWSCSKFGRTYTVDPSTDSALQMNGFSGTALANEDWLISPPFNLVGTTNPVLQFYSRTKFAGNGLQLKVSTNYITGTNPNTATWTTINGNFPASNTDVWILSDNLDLSAFIGTNVYIAWVYTSTTTAAARWTIDDIKVAAGCTPPTTQPTALNLNSTLTSISGSFTASSPAADGYLVIMSTSPTLTVTPSNNTVYAIDDVIGNGTVINVNNSTSFTVNNLNPATTYYFTVYAYGALQNCYQLVNPLTGNIATQASPICIPPSVQASNLTATNITGTSMDLNYTRGNGDNILIVARANTAVNQNPITGISYAIGATIGTGNTVIYNGPAANFSYTGLNQNITYYFAIYEFFNTDFCYNNTPLTGNFTTICTNPVNVSSLTANGGNTQASIGWTNPTASCYDEIIVVASNAPITGQGSDYTGTADAVYTTPNQIVYKGTGTSVNVTGLSNGTTYYFKIFTRKGALYSSGVTITAAPFDPALGYQYLYGNLHAHSSYSDGNKEDLTKKPRDDYRFARDANCMDFLGISEHNHSGAGMNISNYPLGFADANLVNLELGAGGNSMLTLWGMEWGVISGGGHVLTYGFNDQLIGWEAGNYNIFCAKNDYASLFNLINGQANAFATLAHPNPTDFGNIANTYSASADNAVVGTAIESGPAFATNIDYSNFPFPLGDFEYYKTMLAKGYKLGPTMDGDNHYFTFGRQSTNRLVVLANSKTRADLVSAIKDMRFYASNDCNIKVDYKCNSNPMGSSLTLAGVPSITINVTDPDVVDAVDSIYIYGAKVGDPAPLEPIKKYFNQSAITFDVSDALNIQPNNTTYYYFAMVKQVDGQRVVTAPIWYTRADVSLPITLLNFTATYQANKTVALQWTTAQERNSKLFVIERSIDGGSTFVAIGTVNAFGNTNSVTQYLHTDLSPVTGTNLYRLKQIDLDGKFEYSKIVAITINQKANNYYSLYPTISNQFTTINATSSLQKNITISIFDEAGHLVKNLKSVISNNNPVKISLTNLKSGIYFVKINDNQTVNTQKLIVE